jgi:hypothetical protein
MTILKLSAVTFLEKDSLPKTSLVLETNFPSWANSNSAVTRPLIVVGASVAFKVS